MTLSAANRTCQSSKEIPDRQTVENTFFITIPSALTTNDVKNFFTFSYDFTKNLMLTREVKSSWETYCAQIPDLLNDVVGHVVSYVGIGSPTSDEITWL